MEWYEVLIIVALIMAAMLAGKYLNREIFNKGRNKYED